MNYTLVYLKLMVRARERMLSPNIYVEKHHIIPLCVGGADAPHNIAILTGREHYIAHQLLVKMYPKHKGIAYSVVAMSMQAAGSKPFEWLRKHHADLMRGNKLGVGHKRSDKHKAAVSATHKGKPKSAAQRKKMSDWQIGRKLSVSHRNNLSIALTGYKPPPVTDEIRKLRSERMKQRWADGSMKAAMLKPKTSNGPTLTLDDLGL